MTAIPATTSPFGSQLAALTVRTLRTSARVLQLLMFSLTMPMAMLVLFSQVFRSVAGGAGLPAGVSYIDFLTPAMLAVSTVMAGTDAGVSAAIDHTNGVHDRFAALSMRSGLPGAGPHPQRSRVHPGPCCTTRDRRRGTGFRTPRHRQ